MVMSKGSFILMLSGMTVVYFFVTALQFWATNYFINVLGFTAGEAFSTFAITALTGPVLGAIIGGVLINTLGGYNQPRAYTICLSIYSGS
jgi:hypothetical protein